MESAELRVLLGQRLLAPATHQEFVGQGEQILLQLRKYPALHMNGHDDAVPVPYPTKYEFSRTRHGVGVVDPKGHVFPSGHTNCEDASGQ